MERGFKYRIYPNESQRNQIARTLGCCRFVYNRALDVKKTAYSETGKSVKNLIEQADEIPFYSWEYDGAYDKDEFGSMIYTTMSPEKNYGYEMVEQNEELKHILDSSSQIESAFDYEKYGRAYTEGGEVTVLRDGYIDNCADGPDVDYYDRDELASLIGDRYDAKYPASSSKAVDRSLSHRQEVSRNASELLNDGKQAIETSLQEH